MPTRKAPDALAGVGISVSTCGTMMAKSFVYVSESEPPAASDGLSSSQLPVPAALVSPRNSVDAPFARPT